MMLRILINSLSSSKMLRLMIFTSRISSSFGDFILIFRIFKVLSINKDSSIFGFGIWVNDFLTEQLFFAIRSKRRSCVRKNLLMISMAFLKLVFKELIYSIFHLIYWKSSSRKSILLFFFKRYDLYRIRHIKAMDSRSGLVRPGSCFISFWNPRFSNENMLMIYKRRTVFPKEKSQDYPLVEFGRKSVKFVG